MPQLEDDRIPVTLVSGTLGAGKTTLVNNVLRNAGEYDVAVLVNDMGEVNIDAELIAGSADDDVIDLTNGCICCQLQGDLVSEVNRLARERSFDVLLVEASGISDPVPVARTFLGDTADGEDPTAHYRLDTVVSVVDAYGFWKEFDPDAERPAELDAPGRTLADVLVDQVEFCDVLVLNKCDLVPDDELDEMERVVRELQPRATVYRETYADVSPDAVLATGLFDYEEVSRSSGWKRRLREGDGDEGHGGESHEGHDHADHDHAAAHGVTSFLYESDRPFHPGRLDDYLTEWPDGVVRAKGFFRLATRPETVMGLNRAGPSVTAGPIGRWGEGDDRRTRLVFIGRDVPEESVRSALDDCLTTEAELEDAGELSDPFPSE
ncbi:GTPase, G3E family [Halopelagius inordinatus]|uniref:GTPase, G3E family n=1 Tax=Halopelagius inordinatus TaxID=553467 RepID=A0A1I2UP61_9EURY|nr:GTP-binding protein [Halopelagius inordinatus]SFG78059.1 GTPase, G3E family [Halopelagius inordinatus]